MCTVLILVESREPANFHTGVINGFLAQQNITTIPIVAPRDVTFPWSVYDELVLHATIKTKIDAFFTIQGEQISIKTIKELKRKGIKTVCWQVDDPYILNYASNAQEQKARLREYNLVYTTNMESIQRLYPGFKIKNVKFMPFGYDPFNHKNLKLQKIYNTSFVGSAFPTRMKKYLSRVDKNTITCFGNITGHRVSHRTGNEIANQSKINLNFSDQPKNGIKCLKNRVMEIMGAGQFLLTEDFPEASQLFKIDKDLVTFSSRRELLKKIDYYLTHENERLAIAMAGCERVKRDYSYEKLIGKVMEDIL